MGKSIDTLRREAQAATSALASAQELEEEAAAEARADAERRVRAWDQSFLAGGFQEASAQIGAEVKAGRERLVEAIDADPMLNAYTEIIGGLLAQRFLVSDVYNLSASRLGHPVRDSGSRPPTFEIIGEIERQVMDRASAKAHDIVERVLAEREAAAEGDAS